MIVKRSLSRLKKGICILATYKISFVARNTIVLKLDKTP